MVPLFAELVAMKGARAVLQLPAVLSAVVLAQAPAPAPRVWDDAALADWATPVAALNVRPAHYSSAEYYSVPAENLRRNALLAFLRSL